MSAAKLRDAWRWWRSPDADADLLVWIITLAGRFAAWVGNDGRAKGKS